MNEPKDWLEYHWKVEEMMYARFKDQPVERYLEYLIAEGRRVAEELGIPAWHPPDKIKVIQPRP